MGQVNAVAGKDDIKPGAVGGIRKTKCSNI